MIADLQNALMCLIQYLGPRFITVQYVMLGLAVLCLWRATRRA
jgi:hypothetical protein